MFEDLSKSAVYDKPEDTCGEVAPIALNSTLGCDRDKGHQGQHRYEETTLGVWYGISWERRA